MSDEPTTYQRLAAPFDLADHAKVNKGSGNQTYAPWTSYVERLNDVLGADWSFRVIREGFTETECWVLGEVTAVIDGVTVTRQQYGCEPIMKGSRPSSDLLKTAASDAIKKAASLLGPGLYLSIREEREAVEAEMRAAVQAEAQRQEEERKRKAAANKPQPATTQKVHDSAVLTGANPLRGPVSKERFDLEETYHKGMQYARSIGLEPADQDLATLSDDDLNEVIGALRSQCEYVRTERKRVQAAAS